MKAKLTILELACYEVRRELVNWMEDDLSPELRQRVNKHLETCDHCTAIYDGARNVVSLLGNQKAIELPPGLSQRLYRRLFQRH